MAEQFTGGADGSPDPSLFVIAIIAVVVFSMWQYYKEKKEKAKAETEKKRLKEGKTKSHFTLAEHSKQFNKKEVVKVDENVYCAIGFGLANCIMIEGKFSFQTIVTEMVASQICLCNVLSIMT